MVKSFRKEVLHKRLFTGERRIVGQLCRVISKAIQTTISGELESSAVRESSDLEERMPFLDGVVSDQPVLVIGICPHELLHFLPLPCLEHEGRSGLFIRPMSTLWHASCACEDTYGIGERAGRDELAVVLELLGEREMGSAVGIPPYGHVLRILIEQHKAVVCQVSCELHCNPGSVETNKKKRN